MWKSIVWRSRSPWVAGALLLAAGLVVPGCTLLGSDPTVTYARGTTPAPLEKAPKAGQYLLLPAGSTTPTFTIDLAVGDSYGFVKKADDSIVAVAREQEIPLEAKLARAYQWKYRGKP